MSFFGLTLLGAPSPLKPLLKGADEFGGIGELTPDVFLAEASRVGVSSGIVKILALFVIPIFSLSHQHSVLMMMVLGVFPRSEPSDNSIDHRFPTTREISHGK